MNLSPEVEQLEVAPRAASTIETMRAIGYSPEAALADLIDNSISANARKVIIDFTWRGRESTILVQDDGFGMSGLELGEAMRLGSGNPLAERASHDLGRFGMGLKTASFSQCRRLTVLSRKSGYAPVYWCWDLDHVAATDRWHLLRTPGPAGALERLDDSESGTIVAWELMDRLVGEAREDSDDDQDRFWRMAKDVKTHLAMVFHRYIESGKLKLIVNGDVVEPWNPFMPGSAGCQQIASESLLNGRVEVRSYVLPHLSRLSRTDRHHWGGRRGWTAMQGFYVYRNERLLVGGSWLGLHRRDEDSKLARIMVDIRNTDDAAWQIDIKKSTARPPAGLRSDLERLGRQAKTASARVFRHRGVRLGGQGLEPVMPVWDEMMRQGRRFYQINRSHSAVAALLDEAGPLRDRLETLLRLIEETVPAARIFSDFSQDSDRQGEPLEGEDEARIMQMMQPIYALLVKKAGPTGAAGQLRMMQPFNLYPDIIEQFLALQA